MKKDLSERRDVELMVNTFYDKVRSNELLGPIFDDVAQVDWPHHLPKMYDFWGSMLLGDTVFTGNVMSPHLALHRKTPLGEKEFAEWLRLFNLTVDELFEGEKATEAKTRAASIAQLMAYKVSTAS